MLGIFLGLQTIILILKCWGKNKRRRMYLTPSFSSVLFPFSVTSVYFCCAASSFSLWFLFSCSYHFKSICHVMLVSLLFSSDALRQNTDFSHKAGWFTCSRCLSVSFDTQYFKTKLHIRWWICDVGAFQQLLFSFCILWMKTKMEKCHYSQTNIYLNMKYELNKVCY